MTVPPRDGRDRHSATGHPAGPLLRAAPLVLAGLLLGAAAILPGALGLGYDHWLAVANAASAKGSAADYLTPAVWSAITVKARWVAAALALLGALTVWRRRAIVGHLQRVAADAGATRAELQAWLRRVGPTDGMAVWAAAGALTLAAIAIRLRDLGQPLRSDEALVFLNFVRRPLYLIVAMYNDVANHVFETVLKHGSWLLFGDAEWAIRLPAFVAGCLLTPLFYLTVRAAYGRVPALLAAALSAGSSFLLEYSVNARGYELLALWTVVLMALRFALIRRDNTFLWLCWAVASALTFWTHPAAILSYGVVATWLLIGLLLRRDGGRWNGLAWLTAMCGLGMLLTLLLYSPILITSGAGHMNHMMARGAADLRLGQPWQRLVEMWAVYTRSLPVWLAGLMAAAAGLGALLEPRRISGSGPLALAALAWIGGYLLAYPMFGFPRLWLPHALFFYLFAAIGLGWAIERLAPSRHLAAGILAALALAAAGIGGEALGQFVRGNADGAFFESRETARDLAGRLQPGDVIYAPCPAGMPLLYGLLREGIPARVMTANRSEGEGAALQVLTLDPPEGAGPSHPKGTMYVVLTDESGPFEHVLPWLFPSGPASAIGEIAQVERFPHSVVYGLPVPDDFRLH